MIYLHISDNSIEIIQTKKGFLAKNEKIIACSRKVLDPQAYENGNLNREQLILAIKDALKNAYPAEIKDKVVGTVLPDNSVVIKRITLQGSKETSEEVIEKAKEFLTKDITFYENFYKEINKGDIKQVVFTAIPLSTVISYAKPLKSANLKLSFLSSTAFSIYAFLRPLIGQSDNIIYLDINHMVSIVVLDEYGPLSSVEKKIPSKNIITEVKNLIKKIQIEQSISVSKLIIGGEKSLELTVSDIQKELDIPVIKMSIVVEEILSKQNIKLDTGGVPAIYFDKVLGLINLAKMSDVPNFATDLKNLKEEDINAVSQPLSVSVKETETNPPEIPLEKKEAQEVAAVKPGVKMEVEEVAMPKEVPPVSPLVPQSIIEYKKSGLSAIFGNRLLLTGLFSAISLIIIGSFLLIAQSRQLRLPFISAPTPTPTVTPQPTLTPTPTINPQHKRSDIKLQLLNGTDKTGFAKSAAEKLAALDYQDIAVGNADRDDYQSTVIRVKEDARKYLPLVVSDLSKDFDTSTVESLPADSKFDFVIVLGQK
ncbi:hypothetical protein A2W14_03680 [Candidatus Gottesmanbacteria bacterium RBG_16_37_8]|uniref:LytR/CpsA/Psr regulator C-terminal domain-containing protein n=1 Tax=Candidatus Gottesmanbacteria bacterium RBG_16_37_8 TaxID=1798371 RepID=A0A1F5YT47_9BACT|nr:MAG: hypothetical protein A2W14_03680 [Candidatus Gottesmanbacteria bacterium RBG_16_37_8]